MIKLLNYILSLIFILLLSSCASRTRKGPTFDEHMPKVEKLGVITDATVKIDPIGTDYYSFDISKTVAENMTKSSIKHLTNKGYDVFFKSIPFIGASLKPGEVFEVKETNTKYKRTPILVLESLNKDPEYKKALLVVIQEVRKSFLDKNTTPSDFFSKNNSIKESLGIIAERTGLENLLVFIGEGSIESKGKLTSQIFLRFLSFYPIASPQPGSGRYLNTYAGFIDLKNGELFWARSYSFLNKETDIRERFFYSNHWASRMLHDIPARKRKSD